KAQQIKPTLYDGSVISNKHVVILVIDDQETLILEEVSRSKMLAKQNDPISKDKRINTTPINYVELNQLSEDFAPSELPKVSLVDTSLKKLKFHLSKFDAVVKKHITPDAITEGEWGFEHTKAVFLNEIIPFLKTLKEIFDVFDKDLLNEVTEVQTIFNQMKAVVQQCSVDKQCFEIHKKELFLDNDQLLQQIMSHDVLLTVMNSITVYGDSMNLEMQRSKSCDKCFDLDVELWKKQKCDKSCDNKNALQIPEYFKSNDLKAQLQAKDTTIRKLKDRIKSMRENDKEEKVKQDMDEIKTIHTKLKHRLGHNLFSVGQFCDSDLDVDFWKNPCFIRDLDGVDLLLGSRDTNLYIIYLDDMLKTSPIYLLSKALNTKSWLWHSYALDKSKKSSHQPKAEDTNQEKLYLLHMDLCGMMHVESINGKKYILVIVYDYSRFSWVKFLRSKDDALDAIIKCIKNIQVHLNATVRNVRIDMGTEFVNQTLQEFYENVGIWHQTSVARTPQQNGVIERRN
ncbi:retrovirus-related pol polyprotein from transposon TNT 1-94, partial [Tanacetum coccineum]